MKPVLLSALALLLVAAAPAPDAATETEHKVVAGETLHGIANRAGVSREAIIAANSLTPPFTVRIGQILTIPRTQRHRVVKGDTAFLLAWRYNVTWRDIAIANNLPADSKPRVGQVLLIPSMTVPPRERTPAIRSRIEPAPSPARTEAARREPQAAARFAWPLGGTIRRGYSSANRTEHPGLDITARAGTAVRAAAEGQVLFAGLEPQQYGNMVILDHGGGWFSVYAFLSRVTVKEGERVKAAERVGLVGRTGQARGDELHFELRRDNRPVDPVPLLPERD
ncbi:MAG: M23 family metallopeptidase [Novosphingobium sp.]